MKKRQHTEEFILKIAAELNKTPREVKNQVNEYLGKNLMYYQAINYLRDFNADDIRFILRFNRFQERKEKNKMDKAIEKMLILRERLSKVVIELTALKNFFEKCAKKDNFDYSILIKECENDIEKYGEGIEPINYLIENNAEVNKAFYQRYGAQKNKKERKKLFLWKKNKKT